MKQKTKYKVLRVIAAFLVLNMLAEIIAPTLTYALTSGPSQPEVQSFEPVGTTEMVDLFSGDFTYNIPLFELPGPNGGYPFNLHYNSGITMDQEASWVGLGWNLNPGAITRQMRGLPDEFKDAKVKKKMDMKPNVTIGLGVGVDVEIFGGDVKEGLDISVSGSLSIYYNNYKGVGYTIGHGVSASLVKGENGGMAGGLGFNLTLDSQEGIGMNASLSFKDKVGKSDMNYNIGIGYSSRSGLQGLNFAMTATSRQKLLMKDHEGGSWSTEDNDVKSSIGASASISLAHEGYTPMVSMPMRGKNINLQFKAGGTLFGINGNGMINGFFTTQYLKDRGTTVEFPAYGYLNSQEITSQKVMQDFNREKDGQIRENSPNLAIPVTTPDIYSVTAQGMAGNYRAFRNDVGVLFDTEEESKTSGGALGIEIGPGVGPEIGADVTVNFSNSRSGKWTTNNTLEGSGGLDFKKSQVDNLFEPVYFKSYGEHTSDPSDDLLNVAGDEPVKIQIEDIGDKTFRANKTLVSKSGVTKSFVNPTEEREQRNVSLTYINNDPALGMQSVGPDGTRYIYGRPLMNNKQVECMFALDPPGAGAIVCGNTTNITRLSDGTIKYKHDNTDQFLSRTEMPGYAYAYMITEVLGPDYVDVDGNGVSANDLGYWVKFNYATSIDYRWRAPLEGANYSPGLRTLSEDDRGSYMYGEKKIFYLTSVETKTHVAEFTLSDRNDGYGVTEEVQQAGQKLDFAASYTQKKLDMIVLRSKADLSKPIKTVNFSYSYKLCKGTENNKSVYTGNSTDPLMRGKLTLESVWFTYGKNNRGRLSPYVFEYASSTSTAAAENPDYNYLSNDRWGYYKPDMTCDAMDFPYVTQFNTAQTEAQFRAEADLNMSVWNLKKIQLPTGGTIEVQYEADDYAYVQNKRAMQMFKMTGFAESHVGYTEADVSNANRKIYFELEKPIPVGASANTELAEYFSGVDKLYWNVYMYVRKSTDNYIKDYVSGYNDIESYGFDNTNKSYINGAWYYTRGYVDMKKSTIGTRKGSFKELRYHPFSLAAWQYIRTQNPTLSGFGPFNTDPNSSKSAAMNKIKSLTSIIPDLIQTFQGFHNYADSHGWGSKVVLNKSYIRLNSPDKIKLGGGCRVKKIVLTDNWSTSTASAETDNIYGQVYDYTMIEGNRVISSGVAANEPQIGADENPLRKAKEYTEMIPMKTDNNLYFEYPVNESYYPGASVGYRKVTVKSLATHYEAVDNNTSSPGNQNEYNIPAGIMTTGATTHEFYTAKEFPVIADETEIEIRTKKLTVPIPLIGQYGEHEITATQGYSVILNDMHGKPKKVSNYRQSKTGAIIFDAEISSVEYIYHQNTVSTSGNVNDDYYMLNNLVDVIVSDKGGSLVKGQRYLGQDYEFFTDMREMKSEASNGGLKINTDVLIIGPATIPAFVPWPNASDSKNMIRTAVTNKIIHRSGILKETKAYDAGNLISTKNVYYDALTGQPLLTSVTTNFGDPIYDYKVPAHMVYEGMGPAYKNIGLTFTTPTFTSSGNGFEVTLNPNTYNNIMPGDEFITGTKKGTVVRKLASNIVFVTLSTSGSTGTTSTIIRSGRRNLLSADASNIRTLGQKGELNTAVGNPVDGRSLTK